MMTTTLTRKGKTKMSLRDTAIQEVLDNIESLKDEDVVREFKRTLALLIQELDNQGEFEIGDDLQERIDELDQAFTDWMEALSGEEEEEKEIKDLDIGDEPLEDDN